jgi:hypothetical protein
VQADHRHAQRGGHVHDAGVDRHRAGAVRQHAGRLHDGAAGQVEHAARARRVQAAQQQLIGGPVVGRAGEHHAAAAVDQRVRQRLPARQRPFARRGVAAAGPQVQHHVGPALQRLQRLVGPRRRRQRGRGRRGHAGGGQQRAVVVQLVPRRRMRHGGVVQVVPVLPGRGKAHAVGAAGQQGVQRVQPRPRAEIDDEVEAPRPQRAQRARQVADRQLHHLVGLGQQGCGGGIAGAAQQRDARLRKSLPQVAQRAAHQHQVADGRGLEQRDALRRGRQRAAAAPPAQQPHERHAQQEIGPPPPRVAAAGRRRRGAPVHGQERSGRQGVKGFGHACSLGGQGTPPLSKARSRAAGGRNPEWGVGGGASPAGRPDGDPHATQAAGPGRRIRAKPAVRDPRLGPGAGLSGAAGQPGRRPASLQGSL